MLKKSLKIFAIIALLLLLLVFSVGYFFFNTTSGIEQALQLANRYSGYQIDADTIEGKFLKKTAINGLNIRGDNLNLKAKSVILDWDSGALFNRSLLIKSVQLNDAELTLKPSETVTADDEKIGAIGLGDIDLPFSAHIEDLQINRLTIKNPVTEKADFFVEHFQLGVDYQGQKGTIHTLDLKAEGIDLKMSGEVTTKGDYPLHLLNKTTYSSSAYGSQIVDANIDGELKKQLAIHIRGEGLSDFTLIGQIENALQAPTFSADLKVKKVDTEQLQWKKTTLSTEITASGHYQLDNGEMAVTASGRVFYDSPQTEQLALRFQGEFDGEQLSLPELTVDLLTAKQQLRGKADYSLTEQQFNVALNSEQLHWPQSEKQPTFVANQLAMIASGNLDNYQVKLTTDAQTSVAGDVPLSLTATGSQQVLSDFTATALINQKPLTLSGKAAWSPTLDYRVQLAAPEINAIGAIPNMQQLEMLLKGDDSHFSADGQFSVASETIPPSQLTLQAKGSYTEIAQADIIVNTLGGQASINAKGSLSPLALTATVKTENIQPQQFYPQVKGNINSQFDISANNPGEQLQVTTTIQQLNGRLQGYPLSGQGQVDYYQADNQLSIKELAINVAGNQVNADGTLALDASDGQSDLRANINAKQLQRLLPDLRGALSADIVAQGSLSAPEIQAKINAKQLKYQHYQVQSLLADAVVSLHEDKLSVTAQSNGVRSGETLIDKIGVELSGKISSHRLQVKLDTPKEAAIPNVLLSGQGGLNTDTLMWQGQLSQLRLSNALAGTWQLAKPSQLHVGRGDVNVQQLCLQQKQAKLCADGQITDGNGEFDIAIQRLKTKQFEKYLPNSIALDTTMSGKTKVALQNGIPTVNGDLAMKGGTLRLNAGQGDIVSKIERFDTKIAIKNNRLESVVDARLSKLGAIKITAALPNLNQSVVQANIKIDNKRLDFLEQLVPQLSNVNGHLNGEMRVKGDPNKRLDISGNITLHKTDFDVPQFGTEIRQMTLDIFALNGQQFGFKGGAKAGGGDFVIDGKINPTTRQGEIDIKGKDFQVANSKKLQVAISPDLRILFADSIRVRGEIAIPRALIVPESTGSKITASEDVVLPGKKPEKKATNSPLDMEVAIKLGDNVRVASADIETRLRGEIDVRAKPHHAPTASGSIEVQTGEMRIYGQLLNIERGRVIFSHGPMTNPALDIRASRTIDDEDITVGANVLGTAKKPEISLFSTPNMPDSSILSYLLFGRPPNSDSFGSAALLQTGGLVGANALARNMRSSVGLDVLDFSLTGMEAGKNLSKKMYLGMRSSFFDAINEFLLEYKLSSKWKLESTVNNNGQAAGDLIYILETD